MYAMLTIVTVGTVCALGTIGAGGRIDAVGIFEQHGIILIIGSGGLCGLCGGCGLGRLEYATPKSPKIRTKLIIELDGKNRLIPSIAITGQFVNVGTIGAFDASDTTGLIFDNVHIRDFRHNRNSVVNVGGVVTPRFRHRGASLYFPL